MFLSPLLMEDYYNFILVMYIGFLFIYLLHPEPQIFHRNKQINRCNKNKKELCIEE
jgi:hypothetical protein